MTEGKKVTKRKPAASSGKKTKIAKPVEQENKDILSKVSHLPQTPTTVLGEVAWLMMQNPNHKYMYLADLEWLVLPAVTNKQFRLFKKDNVPIAYISWAYLDIESENRLIAGAPKLRPGDWAQGDESKAWLIDVIAPFGGGDEFVRHLKQLQFSDRQLMSMRPAEDGKGLDIVEITDGKSTKAA